MEDYCGEPLWNRTLSWETKEPDLTPCFQRTVLLWIPCTFLWLLIIYEYKIIRSKKNPGYIPWTIFNGLKHIIISILIILQLVELIYGIFYVWKEQTNYVVDKLTPVIKLVTFIVALLLTHWNKKHGRRTSGILFIFWFLLCFCELPAFRTAMERPSEHPMFHLTLPFVSELIYYPIILVIFILNCWADKTPIYQEHQPVVANPCPEASASYLSRLFFFWVEGLARKGYRKPLEFSDLWTLRPANTSKSLNPVFTNYWNEQKCTQRHDEIKASFHKPNGTKNGGAVDVNFKPAKRKLQQTPSMGSILFKTYYGRILFGSFLKLLHDLLSFVSPLILKLILDQVEIYSKTGVRFEHWKGYFYVSVLLGASFLGSIISNQYFYNMYLLALRIRTTVAGSLYRKALRISSASKEESTTGEIQNLMTVDVEKLTELCPYITTIWSTPLLIGLSLYFLYDLLGVSVFAGLGVMILLIPVNAYIGIRVRSFQTRQMKYKDTRIKFLNEVLAGIKVIKLYAWEPSFESQITKVRKEEINVLRGSVKNTAVAMFIWTCAPVVVALATFATFVMIDENNVLDAQTAFVSIALFNIMRLPLNLFPVMLVSIVQAAVGLKRINKYMNSPDVDKSSVTHNLNEDHPIVIENATMLWKDDTPVLRNINHNFNKGSLTAVVGSVGSGKSTLLSAMLGEVYRTSGKLNVYGTVAYVSQEPWIQNATVKDNILFDKPYDQGKYDEVIEACALGPDLAILPSGDQTEIGEKGINLSGGQRQRVSLARAIYSNADIYLLDDPLSAVDSNVGKHIFDKLIGSNGLLRKKTRVLVTHGAAFLPQMDEIVVLKHGTISESGSYRQLLFRKGDFAEFLLQHVAAGNSGCEPIDENILLDLERVIGTEEIKLRKEKAVGEMGGSGDAEETEALLKKSPSREIQRSNSKTQAPESKTILEEEVETGNIKLSVIIYYLRVVGWPMALTSVGLQLLYQFFAVGSNVWLSIWSSDVNQAKESTKNYTSDGEISIEAVYSKDMYLCIYGILCVGQGFAIFIATLIMAFATLKASSLLHWKMLERIMRAPVYFFDTTPLGRIVNRFSKDVDTTDNAVPMSLSSWLKCVFNVIAALGIIIYTTPGFVVGIIPTAILYFLAQRYYVTTSRQLKRLESVSRSPIYSFFAETLAGAPTIRAFAKQESFVLKSEEKIDFNQKCNFCSIVATRFLSVCLELSGNILVFFAFLFAVVYGDHLTTGMAGLALSYALQITHGLNWLVETTNNVENNLVAVERLKEYGEIKQEKSWEAENSKKPPVQWPNNGEIKYEKVAAKYREELDIVLNGVSFEILGGERVGVVGRTGAGKTSLTLALFRIIESTGGRILVDNIDISKIGLHDLRKKLTIIPQDPFIFSGTIRANLDPFSEYSDSDLWHSLDLAHLKGFVEELSGGLEYELTEGGDNLSVGQKQLICLARALLRKDSKILVLDEATAAIDLDTDEFIQQAIRNEFKNCTVLTIAHRLNTIMDYTRILVLENGLVKEFDTPEKLLADKNSLFYSMARDANLV